MNTLIAYIGENYKYPNRSKNKFKLKAIESHKYLFECGHWCTENVFMDLVRIKTGVQVYNERQLKLFY